MPHVSIKHFSRTFTDSEKADLVTALTRTVTRVFGVEPGAVSIAVEPVAPSDWTADVHTPEIEAKAHLLWKQPHYSQPVPTEGTR
ncbi:tautomerase family protein [Streptomyces sp. M2CJ-2]|uniref:tautomerase family protein n=1 Tax=Streptomyces sp. M2CJ-2 TaxID=2803948 RepID=UPI001928DD6E|nr:tautomerase family protein [Streptomyces sp. M2CJ-2]MBL3670125.1 tautomerase family protein [Streptomyces sp. M2CJ-2]